MVTFLTLVHVLFTLALIGGVLMQSSKSAGLSGAIGGGAEKIFGKKKGMDDMLARWTTVFAVGFLLSALVLTVVRS